MEGADAGPRQIWNFYEYLECLKLRDTRCKDDGNASLPGTQFHQSNRCCASCCSTRNCTRGMNLYFQLLHLKILNFPGSGFPFPTLNLKASKNNPTSKPTPIHISDDAENLE